MAASRPSLQLPGPHAGQFGFTLVELIITLVLVGIIATFAVPRLMDQRTFDVTGFSNQVTALIRHGQKQAIAQNRNVYVRLNGAGVALCYDQDCNGRLAAPGSTNSASSATLAACANVTNWACEGVPNGLAMTAAAMFYFDPAGRPFLASDGANAVTSTFANTLTVRVTGSSGSRDTLVEPETGFVR